jgi:hypothetical protein
MADGPTYSMDVNAVLDFAWDWSNWLAPLETIVTSTVTASPGISVDSSTNSTSKVTVWLSGGTSGRIYTVTNLISTNQGRTDERTITIRVVQR